MQPVEGLPTPQRFWALLTVYLGMTMAVLDGSIANVALPSIARDLHAPAASSVWVINAYQLVVTVCLLPLSSLGDIVGYRRVYRIGMVIFTVERRGEGIGALAALAVAALLAVILFRRQSRLPVPLVPVDLFRDRTFRLSVGTSLFSFMAQMLAFVSLPFLMEYRLGRSQYETGLLITPWPVAVAVMAPIAGRLADRYSASVLAGIGLGLFSVGLCSLGFLPRPDHRHRHGRADARGEQRRRLEGGAVRRRGGRRHRSRSQPGAHGAPRAGRRYSRCGTMN